jgi:hypothetical protein
MVKKMIVWIVLITLLSGCTTQFTYNRLNWIISWYLEDFVDLSDSQENAFERKLNTFLVWHRKQALPEYIVFLEKIKQQHVMAWDSIHGQMLPFDKEQINKLETHLTSLFSQILSSTAHHSIELLITLNQKQIVEIGLAFDKKNRSFEEKFLQIDEEALRQIQRQRVQNLFEHFLGELNSSQRASLTAWQKRIMPNAEGILQTRKRWQQSLIQLLKSSQNLEKVDLFDRLSVLLIDRKKFQSAMYKKNYAHNRELFYGLIQAMQAAMTQEQFLHLIQEIESYQQDFKALSQQS